MALSISRVQYIQHLSSALYFCLSFVCQMKIRIISVHFLYSLSFIFFSLSQHLQVFKSPQELISSLSVAPRPLFPYYWPTPPVDFLPYSWIFLHIHKLQDRRVCVEIYGWGDSTGRVQQRLQYCGINHDSSESW